MGVVPFLTAGDNRSVVFAPQEFRLDGKALFIINPDMSQFDGTHCNASYDLRVGAIYRDHRNNTDQALADGEYIRLLPGNAVIIQTEEEIRMPKWLFGQILPRVSMLQKGIANTPSKIDPGYPGRLLITAFNHGKRTERLYRKQPFCSLHLLTVEDGITPYNQAAKQLTGVVRTRRLQRIRDALEKNQIWITFGVFIVAIIALFHPL
jgi:dCTP deaminase